MMPPAGWTVPPPPGPPTRPIRTGKVFAGIGLAVLGQVVAIGLGVLAVYLFSRSGDGGNAFLGVWVEVALQVVLFGVCLAVGIVWIVRRDRGIGLGLLIGWAVSTLVLPVAGIGVCLAVINDQGGLS